MKPTSLFQMLQGVADAPPQGQYRGAMTCANFGDVEKEFSALRAGCGVYDLGFRAKISLTGNDRVRWLNGMVSNKIKDMTPGTGVYAFVLNTQGHILGDMYAYNRGEVLVVDTDSSQVEKVLGVFRKYIISDKVELKNLSEELTAVGVAGPKSREVLRTAGIEVPEMLALEVVTPRCDCDCDCLECTLVRSDAPGEAYEIWIAPSGVKQVWDALIAAGATPVGAEAVEKNRIVSGVPLYGVDIREKELPQETEQIRAVHYQKGCYIGQEIVERIRSRGNVHRKFTGFVSEGTGHILPGTKIDFAEKEVGEVTSVASLRDAEGERTVALGYIRRGLGGEVMIGDRPALVVEMPLTADLPRIQAAVVNR